MQPRVVMAVTKACSWLSVARAMQTALLLVLMAAAYQRFSLPQVPLADPDTWGYLHPVLSKLSGSAFQHTHGRGFVYPGWLYLVLRITGDFRAIAVAQHLLGLGTGVLLWVCWHRWNATLHPARLPALARQGVGLLMVAFYLFSIETVQFESEIRPEAVFPFFCVLNLYFSLVFIRAWRTGSLTGNAWLVGAANIFNTALIYFLKPSFGFAAGFAVLPAVFFLGWGGASLRFRLGMVAVPTLAAILLLWLPEHLLKQADPITELFLPETLLTVHAAVICDQMREDLVDNETQPYSADWLTGVYLSLEHELAVASEAEQTPYPSLGFNPDYLMYGHSICQQLYTDLGPAGAITFCNHYFLRAWEERPGPMLANSWRQMRIFYGANCPAYRFANEVDLAVPYRAANKVFDYPIYQSQMQLSPLGRAYLADCRRLQSTPNLLVQPRFLRFLSRHAAQHYLPILLGTLAVMVAVGCLPAWRRAFLLPGAILLLFFSYNFGNCLTIAFVHSLDGGRYTANQLAFTLLAQFAAVVFLAETFARLIVGRIPTSDVYGLNWLLALPATRWKVRPVLALLLLVALALLGAGCTHQKFYSHGEPTDEEQAALQLLNRLRTDADSTKEPSGGEPGTSAGLVDAGDHSSHLPPLCFNAEALHTQRRLALQAAVLMTGRDPAPAPTGRLPLEASFRRDHPLMGESLDAVFSPTAWKMPLPFTEETDPQFKMREEIGIGLILLHRLGAPEADAQTWLRAVGTTALAPARRFLLGAVYHDNNRNGYYDPGEGVKEVEVRVSNATFYTRTSKSGGYAVPLDGLPENAAVKVRFYDSVGLDVTRFITLHQSSEELDLRLPGLPSADLVGTLTDLREKFVLPTEGDKRPTGAQAPGDLYLDKSGSDKVGAGQNSNFSFQIGSPGDGRRSFCVTDPDVARPRPGLGRVGGAEGESDVQQEQTSFVQRLVCYRHHRP